MIFTVFFWQKSEPGKDGKPVDVYNDKIVDSKSGAATDVRLFIPG